MAQRGEGTLAQRVLIQKCRSGRNLSQQTDCLLDLRGSIYDEWNNRWALNENTAFL